MVDKHHGRGDHGDSVNRAYPQDEQDFLIYGISRANDIDSIDAKAAAQAQVATVKQVVKQHLDSGVAAEGANNGQQ